jgi:hypothetical protein
MTAAKEISENISAIKKENNFGNVSETSTPIVIVIDKTVPVAPTIAFIDSNEDHFTLTNIEAGATPQYQIVGWILYQSSNEQIYTR